MPRAQLNLEKPTPLQMEQLQWIIITSENADEVFKKLEEQGIDPVLWGLTDKDFELLAKNFARIRNQMKITNDLLDKYKEYYEPEKKEDEFVQHATDFVKLNYPTVKNNPDYTSIIHLNHYVS